MCADSASFQNDLMFRSAEPKIVHAPGGGLIGATGAAGDTYILRRWVIDGMAFDKPPRFSFTNVEHDSSILWLWLKPDLTVWMGDATMNHWLVPTPCAVGYGTQYLHGLLDTGTTLESAVRRTIARMPYLGGEVQTEALDPSVVIRHTKTDLPEGWPPGQESRGMTRERAWAEYRLKQGSAE